MGLGFWAWGLGLRNFIHRILINGDLITWDYSSDLNLREGLLKEEGF